MTGMEEVHDDAVLNTDIYCGEDAQWSCAPVVYWVIETLEPNQS